MEIISLHHLWWHITYTPNLWCNEIEYFLFLEKINVPYVKSTRAELGIPPSHPAFVIFFMNSMAKLVLIMFSAFWKEIYLCNCSNNRTNRFAIGVNKTAKEILHS